MSAIVLTSETLIGTPATGNLEYNGQFFGTDSNASRAQMQRIASGTAVNSTSGTSIDFTGLPAWIKRLTITLSGVSTSGASNQLFQLGTSGGVVSTGYGGGATTTGAGTANANYTAGIGCTLNGAGDIKHGQIVFSLHNASTNLWVATGVLAMSNGGFLCTMGGSVTLSSALTSVRCTTVNGTDTFDLGSINILYEG
jgi:hypothetical protein